MWDTIFSAAENAGIWAVLFVTLFFIQLKDSKAREGKYQELLNALAEKLKVVDDIRDNVLDIKSKLAGSNVGKVMEKVAGNAVGKVMEKVAESYTKKEAKQNLTEKNEENT